VGVAQICAQKKGNWTRYVNHSCAPNCRFENLVVGSRWRVMLVASRGIGGGEEVTVDYGAGYWSGEGRRGRCVCGEEGCAWGDGHGLSSRQWKASPGSELGRYRE